MSRPVEVRARLRGALAQRVFDILFAAPAVIVLSPLAAGVAIAIRAGSSGPVIYRQTRIGRSGRPFKILKFRTMIVDADRSGLAVTVGADPRITPVGRVLRRWKLDELPQLLNIIAVDMSVVGPRPEVPAYVALYPEDARAVILEVRPGLTDPAAIAFRDEASLLAAASDPERTYTTEILPQKIAMYVRYLNGRSLMSDVRVIAETIAMVARSHR